MAVNVVSADIRGPRCTSYLSGESEAEPDPHALSAQSHGSMSRANVSELISMRRQISTNHTLPRMLEQERAKSQRDSPPNSEGYPQPQRAALLESQRRRSVDAAPQRRMAGSIMRRHDKGVLVAPPAAAHRIE
jgi:hypothetical protein